MAGRVRSRQAWRVMVSQGVSRLGRHVQAGKPGRGRPGSGAVSLGRRGESWHGTFRQGLAGKARPGLFWLGWAGKAGPGRIQPWLGGAG